MAQRNNLILATVLLIVATSFAGTWITGPGAGSHGTVSTFPTTQGFEETGVPTASTWIDISTGGQVVNWDYTAVPIDGAQSVQLLDSASNSKQFEYDFPGALDEVWVAWRYSESADPATFFGTMNVIDSATNGLASIRIQTNGALHGIVTTTTGTQVVDVAAATNYRIKVRWKKGTGANEEFQVWAASEASGAWGTPQIQTNGTSTNQADAIYFSNPAATNNNQVFDNVIVSTSDIAWSDLD